MCELLGMSANVPTDICFSFAGLMQRGGATGPHRDGWGIAYYEGKGYRAVHDPQPSADSKLAQFMQSYSIKSHTVISHIRKANRGRVCLENTHPFSRELWGKTWAFAHNGQLKGIKKWPLEHYLPVGTTDSEYAFCWLLDQVRNRFPTPPRQRKQLWGFIEAQIREVAQLGIFNILMSDSHSLYTHCSTKLAWLTRQAPFGNAQLLDTGMSVDFAQETQPSDKVTVIATEPLTTNEQWQSLKNGQFTVFRQGKMAYQAES